MSNDCIFCKIASGEIPTSKVYEDKKIIAFEDMSPQAPVHILIIPKKHIESLREIDSSNIEYIENIFLKIPEIAREKGISKNGYRVVNNIGKNGGQTVDHIHFHLLGGRGLKWPPG